MRIGVTWTTSNMFITKHFVIPAIFPLLIILVGHLLIFKDGITLISLITTIRSMITIKFILLCFKRIPFVRNWMFLNFFLTPFVVCFAVFCQFFIDPSLRAITWKPVYLFCSITLSLLSYYFLSQKRCIWNNKNGIKLAEGLFFSYYHYMWLSIQVFHQLCYRQVSNSYTVYVYWSHWYRNWIKTTWRRAWPL